MKQKPGINFWTKEPVEALPFNIHMFHRVDFRNDDVIIGFMEFGDRSPETLTIDDVGFLTSYFFPPNSFKGTEFSYDIIGRDEVQTALPGMCDTFLLIRKGKRCACPYFELDLAALREAEAMDAACAVRMDAGERAAFNAWASTRPPVEELDPTAHCGPYCKHLEQGNGGPGEYVYRCAAPGNEHIIHVDLNDPA